MTQKKDFEITDSRTHKLKAREQLRCSWCAPNRGCNKMFKYKKHNGKKPRYKDK